MNMLISNHLVVFITGCLFATGLTAGCTFPFSGEPSSPSSPSSSAPVSRGDRGSASIISCSADIKVVSPNKGYALSRTVAYLKASSDVRSAFQLQMTEKVRSVLLALSRGEKPDASDGTALLIAEKADDIYRARAAAGGKAGVSVSDFLKDFIVNSPAFSDECAGFVQLFMPGLRILSVREENSKIILQASFSPEQYRTAKRIIDRRSDKDTLEDFAVSGASLPADMAEAVCCFGWRIGNDSAGEPIILSFGQGVAASESQQSKINASTKAGLDSQNELRKAMSDLIVSASMEKLLRERPVGTAAFVALADQAAALRKKCGVLTIRGSKKLESKMYRLSSSELVVVQVSGMKPQNIMSAMVAEKK